MNLHGGDIYNYKEKLLDFSSNINPLGVPESFRVNLIKNTDAFTAYPDIEYRELKGYISRYLGIGDNDKLAVGNGAVELIYKIIAVLQCSSAAVLSPTFAEYGAAAKLKGMELIEINEYDEKSEAFDTEKILEYVSSNMLMIICNPNNPTGSFISCKEMSVIAAALERKGGFLVVDEAFIEFTDEYPNNSMLNLMDVHNNVIIIRAAKKFFGMPGIRLGYAISNNKAVVNKIRLIMEPWNINTAAVIASETIFADDGYIKASKAWISAERPYVYERLKAMGNIKVYKSYANFHLIKLLDPNIDAWKLKRRMVDEGVLVRTPEGFNNLTPYHIRLAVKDRKANDTMLQAMRNALSSK